MFKVNLKYLILIILASTLAYLNGGPLFYSILYTLLLILLLSILHVGVQWYTTKLKLNLEKNSIRTGEELYIYIILVTLRFLPAPYIIVKNSALEKLKKNYNGDIVTLNFFKEKIIPNDIVFNVRGVYNFSETKIVFTDLFCLIKVEKKYTCDDLLKVYPKIFALNEKSFSGKNMLQNTLVNMSLSEDSNDIRDLRKYRVGDSFKKIHWKLSAKHSEFYVKNFSAVASKNACIFLNMNEESILQQDQDLIEEKVIDFTVSLIRFLQNNDYKIKLYINNKIEGHFYIGTNEDFKLVLEYFVENKSKGKGSFSEFLKLKTKLLEENAWVAIIAQNFDNKTNAEIVNLKNMGIKISSFYSGVANNNTTSESGAAEYRKIEDILLNEDV